MSVEDFLEARDLIDIFFGNGAMNYTDAEKLLQSIGRLQASVNIEQGANPGGPNQFINRLFTHMRDAAILAQAESLINANERRINFRSEFQDCMVELTDFGNGPVDKETRKSQVISSFDKVGLQNAALFLFDEKVVYDENNDDIFPEKINLRCILKEGEIFVIPKERQPGMTDALFRRIELPPKCRESVILPVLYKKYIYGFILTEMTHEITTSGNFLANQIGRLFYDTEVDT